MVHRARTKSRTGCRECKRRHRKCDEARPSCMNCRASNLACSFLALVARPPGSRSLLPRSSPELPPPCQPAAEASILDLAPVGTATSLAWVASSPSWTGVSEEPAFTMRHMELLHHFRTDMTKQLDLDDFFEVTVRRAFQAPWLMDQLLAVSAAHWNSASGRVPPCGLTEAAVLQTKALAQFNAVRIQVASDRFAPTYLFSLLVALHVMFEVFSSQAPFPAFLDPLVQWFAICRGIGYVASTPSGRSMKASIYLADKLRVGHADVDECQRKNTCGHFARLMELVDAAGLDEPAAAASKEAVDCLHEIYADYTAPQTSSTRRVLLVMKFPIVAPPEYVQLVERRCPESLVILAHYAVLLHHTRYFWSVGGSGEFIIKSITQYLGPKWERWLVWPNETTKAAHQSSGATG